MVDYWEDITFQCYRKYERLVDLLVIRQEEKCKQEDLNPQI